MTRQKINYYFGMLDRSLKTTALPTSTGKARLGVYAGEFMLMNENEKFIHFKHIGQRNYIYMHKFTGQITIPVGGAFRLGHFDHY